jgi:hypothetical protein
MPIYFYHMPDHYESYLVIMPSFSILSLHNAENPVEYKREAEFCTLVSSPPLRISPTFTYSLLGLACTYLHCNSRLLSSYYLSFCPRRCQPLVRTTFDATLYDFQDRPDDVIDHL